MKKHHPYLREIAVGAAIAVVFVGGAAASSKSLFSSETAAWVQAVGSMFAIFGGFLVLHAQREHERKDVLEAAARLCVSGMNLLDVHAQDATTSKLRVDKPDASEFFGFEHLRRALESLPMEKLPAAIIPEFAEFQNFIAQAEQRLAAIEEKVRNAGIVASERGLAAYIDTRSDQEKLERLWRLAFDCFDRLRVKFAAHGLDLSKMRLGL